MGKYICKCGEELIITEGTPTGVIVEPCPACCDEAEQKGYYDAIKEAQTEASL